MEGKKTKGKQKIEIKLIKNMEDRFVTFSKRKSGINKKASELATLTGAEVAFVVFSPTGKPYSFGVPSMDRVVKRYLGQEQQGINDSTEQIVEAHRQILMSDLNNHHNQLTEKLDIDNLKMKELKESIDAGRGKDAEAWWETPVEDLTFDKLVKVNNAYNEIFAMISTKLQQKTAGGASTSTAHLNSNPNPNPNPTPPPLDNIFVDHFGVAHMSNPLFKAAAGNGGGGPPTPGPAPSDKGHQWGAF